VIVEVDPTVSTPPYEQLRLQVAAAIRGGVLTPGQQLPPIRQLAADLELAPGTVARAYRELEAAGLVASRGRRGTRVLELPPPPDASARAAQLQRIADDFALRAAELGARPTEAVAAAERSVATRSRGQRWSTSLSAAAPDRSDRSSSVPIG
jgi:GntR family transcriptional regulator